MFLIHYSLQLSEENISNNFQVFSFACLSNIYQIKNVWENLRLGSYTFAILALM